MIKLNEKINKALIDIDFIKRYECLSKKYDSTKTPLNERLCYFDGELIIDSINSLGYVVDFEKKKSILRLKKNE